MLLLDLAESELLEQHGRGHDGGRRRGTAEVLIVDPGAPGLREKLIKIGAKVVRHAKYLTFRMAEVTLPRELFAAILQRIRRFGVPPPVVTRE